MKLKTFSILFFAFFLCDAVFSEAKEEFDWKSSGIELIDTSTTETGTIYSLKDPDGRAFTIGIATDRMIPEEAVKRILELIEFIYDPHFAEVESLHFLISEKAIDIHLIPTSFQCDETNIKPYIPSGMFFSYTDNLLYNFRLSYRGLFLRISGIYTQKSDICKKITAALKDPAAHVKKDDINYIVTKIEELENRGERLEADNKKLKYALATLSNHGLFSGPKPIDKKSIERIVQLKEKNPLMTREEIASILQKEKFKISQKELKLVLNVYYGEFE